MQILEHSVIRVLNAHGATIGTGFVVADHLAVTCAHVVEQAGCTCEQSLRIQFYKGGQEQEAVVLEAGWSPPTVDDVAFLQIDHVPAGVCPVVLGSAEHSDGHSYGSFGFAKLADYDSRKVSDIIDGVVSVRDQRKGPMLQLKGAEIDRGLSGSPVLDTVTDRVIGMVSEYKDNERTRFAWATTADTLAALNPTLQLWPETYGPGELNSYLQYLITNCQRLELPDRNIVELERIYVSLRADEMNATEWKAEHDLYLDEVEQITQALQAAHEVIDQYQAFDVLRKAIVRHPKVLKLTARDWRKQFASQGERSLSLADVVRRHPHIVILGDPGSGKSTLGKWLALQHARAMFRREPRVQVHADLVRPGTEAEDLLDLGETRLPILVRVAAYAQARWPRGQDDTDLPLERFLGQYEHKQDRPADLTTTVMQAIAWDFLAKGQALVILDGLDEVADPEQRKKVMHEVKRFMQHSSPAIALSTTLEQWSKNMLLLTSRIVGYQFDPLTDLPHYTIEEMDEQAITALYRAWMCHVPTLDNAQAEEETGKLTDLLFHHAHAGVRALAGNPLLSTLLVQVYWNSPERTLPASRVGLFEEVTRLFYDQREAFWDRAGIPPLRLQRALGAVAYHIHAQEPTGFTDKGQVQDCLQSVLQNPEQVDAVLVAAREVSGFLVARGEGVYAFLHRSLQEYFVALHLTDPYNDETRRQLIERLATLSLDPAWREPVVLAVGIVSRSRHPENRRLGTLLSALLDAPDPVGSVLPRREFLVAAACAECERPPGSFGRRVAEQLLARSMARSEQAIPPVIRERIREAFRILQRCPAPVASETETVLIAAIQDSQSERRYAAIDLVIETQWDTPAIASALVTAWKTYAGPAGSMLVALEGIAERHPACFTHLGLPLRQADAVQVWEQVEASQEWQAIVRVLYLPIQSPVRAEHVNRDSPLTELIVAAFRQNKREGVLDLLRHQLGPLAEQAASAQARDAALVLAALGETGWVQECVVHVGTQEEILRPLFAALWFFLALAFDLALALASALDFALALARAFDLALARAFDLALARDLARASVPEVEQAIQAARIKWEDDPILARSLDMALQRLQEIKNPLGFTQPIAAVWQALVDAYDKQRSAIILQPQQEILLNQQDEATLDILERLPEDLISLDDMRRERAREFLAEERAASVLGMSCIERMAALAQEHASIPQISTQLEWALHKITHDAPEWIDMWVAQAQNAEEKVPAYTVLANIHRVIPEVFETLLRALPEASVKAKEATLNSLSWLIRLNQIPEQQQSSLLEQLTTCLQEEQEPASRRAIVDALGHWQQPEAARAIIEKLLESLHTGIEEWESKAIYIALARLAARETSMIEAVRTVLMSNCQQPPAQAALIRFIVAKQATESEIFFDDEQGRESHQRMSTSLLAMITAIIPDPSSCFDALIEAGIDNDIWDDNYHGLLALVVERHLEQHPDLIPKLLARLERALNEQDWPARRMALAAVAACAEVMPTKLEQVAQGRLEALLVQGTIDAESFTSRRFALTALSYLRTITPAIVPALLAGCRDIEVVQQDAIAAAGRFQEIQGDVLSDLVPWLTGESVSTAYGVAQVLGALGTSMAGEAAKLHGQIIEALVEAIKNPRSQRKVIIARQVKGTLEDALYTALLQVAGWLA